MPFKGPAEFIKRVSVDPTARSHCFFHLSPDTVKKLKAEANEEIAAAGADDAKISSLQAVSAHLWRSITRARKPHPQTPAVHVILVGYRSNKLLSLHPVPRSYTGNACGAAGRFTTAEELTNKGLGAAALLLNKQIAAFSEEEVYKEVENWGENPKICYLDYDNGMMMYTGGSPRFDVFGCDFGWGRPVAMRTGRWNVAEGTVGVYRGAEEGSLEVDVHLAKETMSALLKDEEFVKTVCLSPH
ncbi:uncharacterized protein A4U43_C01F6760 [Asparagus officinalis]|uniref:Uncharacterized protein n=1 Tax=Asparagus officinalis TaxID=4686 RepID=A0A5P1FPX6_ASPOF|nr:uncharacterized acetyltransferase At3g50280-like [Asparagus officinalis]ONK79477.1 uncharacterized protein A4U43_C01F6760 [Asparagus officinalis]